MKMEGVLDYEGEKCIKHYSSSHRILLVGEGDFSFAACLGAAFGSAENIVATSLDCRASLLLNYSRAASNLNKLEDLGCTIMHQVDAHTMSQHPLRLFDVIIFNFPHANLILREHDSYQIDLHKHLVKGFLRNARELLAKNGEVHVTHKTAHPFSKWEIEDLAVQEHLYLHEKSSFQKCDYPGYVNKRGQGFGCDESFPVGECSTFKFYKAEIQCDA